MSENAPLNSLFERLPEIGIDPVRLVGEPDGRPLPFHSTKKFDPFGALSRVKDVRGVYNSGVGPMAAIRGKIDP